MTMLWVREKHLNVDTAIVYNDTDWYESVFDDRQLRDLLKAMNQAFGRVRSVWKDKPGGGRHQVGWVFEKRVPIEGAPADTRRKDQTYLREVWVEVSIGNPRQTTSEPLVASPWA